MALFLLVRAVLMALTHVAPSSIDPQKAAPFFNSISCGSDLFFSGHTGLPFLAALAFWHIPQWRIFYLALTGFFGSVVLLGHYHDSIDVLAALFITHGVFQISCWLFGRDYAPFRSSESQAAPRPKRASRKTLVPADGGHERASKPFVLHVVGEESMPRSLSKADLNRPNGQALPPGNVDVSHDVEVSHAFAQSKNAEPGDQNA